MSSCPLHLEDREFLATLQPVPRVFASFARPESVGVEWHNSENQGQIGSCQGNGLSSCIERLEHVARLTPTPLSRIYAYLRSQQLDGLLGSDQGSTISSGGKVGLEGLPPESLTGYPRAYPGGAERQRILELREQATHKAVSLWQVPEDPEEAKNWIGGGGAISIGIAWPGLPNDRFIRTYRGGTGGHAVAVLGYKPDRLIAVNSWGDGPFEIADNAWRQMHRHRYTAMVGFAGSAEPEPQPIPEFRWTW